MSLQTAGYLVKGLGKALKGEKVPVFIEYLKCVIELDEEKFVPSTQREILNIDIIRKCLRYRVNILFVIQSKTN